MKGLKFFSFCFLGVFLLIFILSDSSLSSEEKNPEIEIAEKAVDEAKRQLKVCTSQFEKFKTEGIHGKNMINFFTDNKIDIKKEIKGTKAVEEYISKFFITETEEGDVFGGDDLEPDVFINKWGGTKETPILESQIEKDVALIEGKKCEFYRDSLKAATAKYSEALGLKGGEIVSRISDDCKKATYKARNCCNPEMGMDCLLSVENEDPSLMSKISSAVGPQWLDIIQRSAPALQGVVGINAACSAIEAATIAGGTFNASLATACYFKTNECVEICERGKTKNPDHKADYDTAIEHCKSNGSKVGNLTGNFAQSALATKQARSCGDKTSFPRPQGCQSAYDMQKPACLNWCQNTNGEDPLCSVNGPIKPSFGGEQARGGGGLDYDPLADLEDPNLPPVRSKKTESGANPSGSQGMGGLGGFGGFGGSPSSPNDKGDSSLGGDSEEAGDGFVSSGKFNSKTIPGYLLYSDEDSPTGSFSGKKKTASRKPASKLKKMAHSRSSDIFKIITKRYKEVCRQGRIKDCVSKNKRRKK